MTQQNTTRHWYQQRIDDCERRLVARRRQDNSLARARVVTFLPAIGLAIHALFWSAVGWPWSLAAGLLVLAFVIVVRVHEFVLRDVRQLRQRLKMNQTQLARLDRRWDLIPTCDVEVPPEYEAVANDLDVFGPTSLYQLISQAHTPFGQETLRDWMLAPATPAEIA